MPACGQVGYWKRCGCCRPGHGQQADCYQFSHHPLPVLLMKRTESVRGSLPTRRLLVVVKQSDLLQAGQTLPWSVFTSAYEVQAEMVCLSGTARNSCSSATMSPKRRWPSTCPDGEEGLRHRPGALFFAITFALPPPAIFLRPHRHLSAALCFVILSHDRRSSTSTSPIIRLQPGPRSRSGRPSPGAAPSLATCCGIEIVPTVTHFDGPSGRLASGRSSPRPNRPGRTPMPRESSARSGANAWTT